MPARVLMLLLAALPALADSRFQIHRMTRDDVPFGKGQCDIRLQVDNEVEVTVRGDVVNIRSLAGQGARDDGSECNASLPNHEIAGFQFEVKDSRNQIRLVEGPSRRNGYSAVVRIHDTSGGFGRYHFRLTWSQTPGDFTAKDRPRAGEGFSWNNTVSLEGKGRGEARTGDEAPQRLGDVSIQIDQGGKLVAVFRADRGRAPLTFNGTVASREGGKWKADVMTDDRRLRGPMYFSVEGERVTSVQLEATDGRDRLKLNWGKK